MNLPNFITKDQEKPLSVCLEKAMELINSCNFFTRLIRFPSYSDEPQFWKYEVEFFSKRNSRKFRYSGGFSWLCEKALISALGEGIERFCLASFDEKNFKTASYIELIKNQKALNPVEVVNFSEKQKKTLPKKYLFNENSRFKWVKGYSLTHLCPIWLPAQLIYVPYKIKNEPVIRCPISTGAAGWSSLAGAIYKGICEIVERDAYMITYLNKLQRPKISLLPTNNLVLKEMAKVFKRYKLELHLIDITTDIPIPAVMAVIVDRTGIGPAVSVGLKASLDPKEAVIGAIEEAQHIRHWVRGKIQHGDVNPKQIQTTTIKKPGERSLFWSKTKTIPKLDFLLKSPFRKDLASFQDYSQTNILENLKIALSFFYKKNLEVSYVDITDSLVVDTGFRVAMVVIPQLQPLYILEPPAYHGGKRLYQQGSKEEELNEYLHPFH